jgi:hypothetical protein
MATREQYESEYAQAAEALETIVKQANTLVFMGNQAELAGFIQQFVAMAAKTAAAARSDQQPEIAAQFLELIRKAESLKALIKPPTASA